MYFANQQDDVNGKENYKKELKTHQFYSQRPRDFIQEKGEQIQHYITSPTGDFSPFYFK